VDCRIRCGERQEQRGAHYAAVSDPAERQRFAIFAASTFVERREDQPTQDALAERFGVSRDQVRFALEQVRKRWERLLRQGIRDQVGADVDVEEELRKLVFIETFPA
jgi:DNA-binding transcriptional regulator LsrR (DeoR family)